MRVSKIQAFPAVGEVRALLHGQAPAVGPQGKEEQGKMFC